MTIRKPCCQFESAGSRFSQAKVSLEFEAKIQSTGVLKKIICHASVVARSELHVRISFKRDAAAKVKGQRIKFAACRLE